jgi:hypothetical protein
MLSNIENYNKTYFLYKKHNIQKKLISFDSKLVTQMFSFPFEDLKSMIYVLINNIRSKTMRCK